MSPVPGLMVLLLLRVAIDLHSQDDPSREFIPKLNVVFGLFGSFGFKNACCQSYRPKGNLHILEDSKEDK